MSIGKLHVLSVFVQASSLSSWSPINRHLSKSVVMQIIPQWINIPFYTFTGILISEMNSLKCVAWWENQFFPEKSKIKKL